MYDLLLQDGDLVLDTLGQPTFLFNKDAVAQIVRQTFSIWLGEWEFDTTFGIDWLAILKKGFNKNGIIQILSRGLHKSKYVKSIISLTLSLDNATRNLSVNYIVETSTGLLTGSVIV